MFLRYRWCNHPRSECYSIG